MQRYTTLALAAIITAITAFACTPSGTPQPVPDFESPYIEFENSYQPDPGLNLLSDLQPRRADGTVLAVVEIPAGSNQKWEVDKTSGLVEWERITADSLRIVRYLAYPANYGFIPRTLVPKIPGGSGDPIDIFILGASARIGTILDVHIIGGIQMDDDGEQDDKLVAVDLNSWFGHIQSIDQLNAEYPGIVQMLSTFLQNYKGVGKGVSITGSFDAEVAEGIFQESIRLYNEADE